MNNVYIIGAGSMAESLIQGWIKNEVFIATQIVVTNRSNKDRLNFLQEKYGVSPLRTLNDLQHADLIVLAMKPKDIKEAMKTISPYISEHCSILSILAGIAIKTIEQGLGQRAIARAMPNTSATVGLSATGIAFNSNVSQEKKNTYLHLLNAIGIVIEVEEDQLHAVTALSGSGPAYIYYLIEAFEQVAATFNLPKEVVRNLMVQTLAGSAAMLKYGNDEPEILRKNVTSPGGTTEAGIKALDEMHFFESISKCVESAEQRSRQLAEEI